MLAIILGALRKSALSEGLGPTPSNRLGQYVGGIAYAWGKSALSDGLVAIGVMRGTLRAAYTALSAIDVS